jgi:hypothetical protein
MLSLLLASLVWAGPIATQLETAPAIVWAGVDYSQARFFVPEEFDDPKEQIFFNPGGGLRDAVRYYSKPKDAWDELVKEWNVMLQHDALEDMEKAILRDVTPDMPGEAGQTSGKKEPFFESQYEAKNNPPTLDQTGVQALVKKYRLKTKAGVGFVIVYERGSQVDKEACVWPTWFDLGTKQVISTERVCGKPGGSGFRSYWYKPMLDATNDIVKALKKKDL